MQNTDNKTKSYKNHYNEDDVEFAIDGKLFNEKYTDVKFCTIVKQDGTPNFGNNDSEHKYVVGLNECTDYKNDYKNDYWFWREDCSYIPCNKNFDYVAKITIPDDAIVFKHKYEDENNFSTDKFILFEFTHFNDCSDDFLKNVSYSNNPKAFMYIKDQDYESCKKLVRINGKNLKYIKNQTEELCEIAIKHKGSAIKYVDDCFMTLALCKQAISVSPKALDYIDTDNEFYEELSDHYSKITLEHIKKNCHPAIALLMSYGAQDRYIS